MSTATKNRGVTWPEKGCSARGWGNTLFCPLVWGLSGLGSCFIEVRLKNFNEHKAMAFYGGGGGTGRN